MQKYDVSVCVCSLNRTDDVSSISGSESDSDSNPASGVHVTSSPHNEASDTESYHVEGTGRRHPRVFLKSSDGKLLSIYRAVIYSKKVGVLYYV